MAPSSIVFQDGECSEALRGRLPKVELIAVDLDGTLLNSHAGLDKATLSAIQHVTDAGLIVVPATGRVLSVLPDELFGNSGIEYVVCCAGATVLRMGESRDSCRAMKDEGFPPEEAAELIDVLTSCHQGDILVDFACEGLMYSEPDMLSAFSSFDVPGVSADYVRRSRLLVDDLVAAALHAPAPIGRVNVFARDEGLRRELMAELAKRESFELGNSLAHNIEINPMGSTKWRGLTWLCDRLGISSDRIMAVGDGSNDVDMLRRSWVGVAMKNASRDALAAADARTTWSNDELGAARLLTEMASLHHPENRE